MLLEQPFIYLTLGFVNLDNFSQWHFMNLSEMSVGGS